LADIESAGVNDIICLGDCIGYGPDPEKVVAEIRQRQIPTIMGNHELAVCIPHQLAWFNPLAQASLRKTLTMLSSASIGFIEQLPKRLVLAKCLCVHGYPPDSIRTYLFQKSPEALIKTFKSMAEPICFVGHTHDLEIVSFDGRRIERQALKQGCHNLGSEQRHIINVGSVGQPRDGNNNAKYVIYDEETCVIEIRFVPYDIAITVAKIKAAGLPENHANRLW
jgi:diadenosine tetraphosphatase ApaH/serine/threonine PP2A family protein phosphatase